MGVYPLSRGTGRHACQPGGVLRARRRRLCAHRRRATRRGDRACREPAGELSRGQRRARTEMATLEDEIHELYARLADLGPNDGDAVATVHAAIELLDRGEVRVAE